MLSLSRGKPIAVALNRDGIVVYTIHVTDENDLPDIVVDNVLELITKEDIESLQKTFKLGKIEKKILEKALKDNTLMENLNTKLTQAMEILKELGESKLKREIDFRDDPDVFKVIPLIGHHTTNYDRSIALIGPSGSGKTFLAKEIIKQDVKKRPVCVFSKIEDDESLQELKRMRTPVDGKSRMIQVALQTEDDLSMLPTNKDLKDTICLFDDLDSFVGDKADFLRGYRDSILECGRHNNITVMSTSHILLNRSKTKTVLNECELLCLFPGANRHATHKFIQDRFGMRLDEANRILSICIKSGRTCILKLSAPNAVIHNFGVVLV